MDVAPESYPSASHSARRSHHRSRSHQSAHADAADKGFQTLDHPLVPASAPLLVTTTTELADLIERLRAAGSFAYDSEFIGELTYYPKLCLIQVASTCEVALIDPLADLDLNGFWGLLREPAVEKIVHAGEQDIEPVIRHTGAPPANVFDTQIAAGFVGLPYPMSLSKLVMEFAGTHLGKGLTFSHWDRRPLSAQQLRYAADDVRYLPLVRQRLGDALQANGHAGWAAEECEAECDVTVYRFDPETHFLRVRGATSLDARHMAVLRELTAWRDAAARSHNVPPRSFLRDEVMLELSRNPVRAVEKLNRVRGLPRPVELAHGARIVELTLKALSLPVDALPAHRVPELSPRMKFNVDALWAAAQCICAGQAIDPALAADRQEVGELLSRLQSGGDVAELRLMRGWRREALGEPLAALVRGDRRLRVRWTEGLQADADAAVSDSVPPANPGLSSQ